jgi:hypothetical protein
VNEKMLYPRKLALESPQTLATVVHAIMLDQYGEAVYDWDPVTCSMEVAADFKAEICTPAMDRWCAMQVVMGSDAFFKRLDAFMNVCNTLASGSPSFTMFDPVTSEEAAWAIAEVALNRDILPFSGAIQGYLRQQLQADGFDPDAGDLPPVFAEVFETRPNEKHIRDELYGGETAAESNSRNIEQFIMEQMLDMEAQFNRIPDRKRIDNLLEDGKDLGEAVEAPNTEVMEVTR